MFDVHELDDARDLVVSRNESHACSVQLSCHLSELKVSTVEATLLQLGLRDQLLGEELFNHTGSMLLVFGSDDTNRNAGRSGVGRRLTSLPLVIVDVHRVVHGTKASVTIGNDVLTRLINTHVDSAGFGCAITTLVE